MFIQARRSINNLWLAHVYALASVPTISVVYCRVLSGNYWRKIIIGLNVVFLLSAVIVSLWIQPLKIFPTYAVTIGSVIIVIFSLGHYYQICKSSSTIRLEKDPSFWLSTGILLGFGGTLLLRSATNYLLMLSLDLARTSLSIQRVLLFLFYISLILTVSLPKQVSESH